jgi:hypothetical protein
VRILDGRVDSQGTPDDLRASGHLDGLVALEETEIKEEAIEVDPEVDKEIEAVAGKGTEPKKGPGKKLIQGVYNGWARLMRR